MKLRPLIIALFFVDVAPEPVPGVPWGPLIVILAVVFILAVSLTVGLVVLLIWLKRRKVRST